MNEDFHRVVGIDLGTTYSALAAYNNDTEEPEIVCDPSLGEIKGAATPSVIWLHSDTRNVIVGDVAKRAIANDPDNTIIEIKREMGATFTADLLDKFGARGVWRADEHPVQVFFGGEWLMPQEISALVLMRMKQIAEAEVGGEIHDAVVTVPAYFTEKQKKATEEAALLAGLYPRQLIPEPTAAAIAYGMDRADPERCVYLVYDLGGGTFDVSIIVAQEEQIEVIATSGDPRLGGGDFDDALTAWVLEQLHIDGSGDSGLVSKIKAVVEEAKRDLSYNEETLIVLPPLTEGAAPPEPLRCDRATFESLVTPTLRDKSLTRVEEALNSAHKNKGVERDDIDAILLVGGSTKIPLVKGMLLDYFQKGEEFVRGDHNPDTVVARGAALVAKKFVPSADFALSRRPEASELITEDELDIRLITEHTLGVGVQHEGDIVVDPLIRQGTNIPVAVMKADYTNPANATNIRVPIYQGEKKFAYDNELIGTIELGEIEPRPPGHYRFEVTFSLDINGLLDVRVKNLNTNLEYQAKFEQPTRIGKDEELAARRAKLLDMYDAGQLAAPTARPEAETAAAPPGALPGPVGDVEPAPSATEAGAAVPEAAEPAVAGEPAPVSSPPAEAETTSTIAGQLVAIEAEVPAEFRQLVRRVQRFIQQAPDEALTQAFNSFATALNAGAPEDELEKHGDELADVFDDVRRR